MTNHLPHDLSSPVTRRRGRTPFALLAGALLALLVLVPAGAAEAQGNGSPSAPPGKAWIRVGHFVPGMGAASVDLAAAGEASQEATTLVGDASYGEVSPYEQLAPGSFTATVRMASTAEGSAPLLSRSFEVTAGAARTLAVVGTSDQPRLVLLTDDLTTPAAGTARVRVLSASEAAGSVSVTAVDGPTIAEGAVLGQATEYATVPAGDWTLQLQGEGADATVQDVPVAGGSVYTIVALDTGDGGVELQVVTDAAGATVAPRGGAETGLGGTAAPVDVAGADALGGASAVLAALAALLATSGLLLRRRRPVAVRR